MPTDPFAADALLSMLLPFWQLVIGLVVLVVVVGSMRKLARRGRSRMTTALIVVGTAIVGLTALACCSADTDPAEASLSPGVDPAELTVISRPDALSTPA